MGKELVDGKYQEYVDKGKSKIHISNNKLNILLTKKWGIVLFVEASVRHDIGADMSGVHAMNLHRRVLKFFSETFCETTNAEFSRVINRLSGDRDHAEN